MYYSIILTGLYIIPLILIVFSDIRDKWLGSAYIALLLIYLIDFIDPVRNALLVVVVNAIAMGLILKGSRKRTILFFWLLFLTGYVFVVHAYAILR